MTNADVSFGEHPRFYIYGIPIARKKHKIGIIIISFIVILKIFLLLSAKHSNLHPNSLRHNSWDDSMLMTSPP